MVKIRLLAVLVFVFVSSASCVLAAIEWNATYQSFILRYDSNSNSFKPFLKDDASASFFGNANVASMNINRSYNASGWDMVEVSTDSAYAANVNASRAYYGAGYLEAFYTFDTISDSWFNWGVPVQEQANANSYNINWIKDHIAYLRTFSADNASAPAYARQTAKFMAWIDGVVAGYNDARAKFIRDGIPGADRTAQLDHYQVFLIQFQDEVGDVNQSNPIYAGVNNHNCPHAPTEYREHCSSLVKLAADDVIITHTTWFSYAMMLRQYKTYTFESASVTLSGYPGTLASTDDWYITSSKLVVTETTNNQFNTSLSNQYVVPRTISYFLRVSVANVLATNAQEWVDIFLTENSGTYSNQWIVLDVEGISAADIAAGTLPANSLWIVENIPGPWSAKADMTWFLNQHKYWPSFNRPYFKSVADISCNTYYADTYGPLWGYYDYSRYLIFKRNHTDVVDIDSMKKMIRYNNWEHDPYSVIPWCSGCDPVNGPVLTVAARYDLISPTEFANHSNASEPIRNYFIPLYNGAIDAKVTSWKSFDRTRSSSTGSSFKVKSYIINGPTNDQQPTFAWSKGTVLPVNSHLGQPDVFNFSWIEVETILHPPSSSPTTVPATTANASSSSPVPGPSPSSDAFPPWRIALVVCGTVVPFVIFVIGYKKYQSKTKLDATVYEEITYEQD